MLPHINTTWPGVIEHAITDSARSRGVSILFNTKCNVVVENKHASNDGRLLLLNVEIDGKCITLVNMYGHNTEKQRKDLFKKLEKWIKLHAKYKENIIVAGDVNCCLREQDRSSDSHLKDKSRTVLENVIQKCELKDAWASISSDPGFTFEDKRNGTRSRLDYIFVSKIVKLGMNDVTISVPDHTAVIMRIYISCNKRGQGY